MQVELKQNTAAPLIEPGTEMEKMIAGVWKQILCADKIGVHATVFDLGGTSFDMVKISKELSDLLHREVAIVTLFTYPTISMLSKVLESQERVSELDADIRTASIEEGKRSRMQKLKTNQRVE
jgi:fengycin family lipopeptide synthetase E